MAKRKKVDFKPDRRSISLPKVFHLTQVQRSQLLKWGLYILTIVLLLTIQDVIMSRIRIFGSTTDLAVCAILLVTVMEGVDVGSVFVLIASTLYYFSGSSPGPYCIVLMSFIGIAATLFRQAWLHRNKISIVITAGAALTLYELGLFVVGLFMGLTRWGRLGAFLVTGGLSWAVMVPLYSLIYKIGLIGGNTWKE